MPSHIFIWLHSGDGCRSVCGADSAVVCSFVERTTVSYCVRCKTCVKQYTPYTRFAQVGDFNIKY